jgi:hypothetical protein
VEDCTSISDCYLLTKSVDYSGITGVSPTIMDYQVEDHANNVSLARTENYFAHLDLKDFICDHRVVGLVPGCKRPRA